MTPQTLADAETIRAVRYKFAAALDDKDWDRLAVLFVDEVDADFTAYGLARRTASRQEIVEQFRRPFHRPDLRTQHIYSNFLIDVHGDTATCTSSFVGYHFTKDFAGGDEFTLHAQYRDHMLRDGSGTGWRIAALALRIFYMTGNPDLLA